MASKINELMKINEEIDGKLIQYTSEFHAYHHKNNTGRQHLFDFISIMRQISEQLELDNLLGYSFNELLDLRQMKLDLDAQMLIFRSKPATNRKSNMQVKYAIQPD